MSSKVCCISPLAGVVDGGCGKFVKRFYKDVTLCAASLREKPWNFTRQSSTAPQNSIANFVSTIRIFDAFSGALTGSTISELYDALSCAAIQDQFCRRSVETDLVCI